MANITAGNGTNTFKQDRLQIISRLPAGIAVFLAALNIFLSITASLGNVLILIALHKVSSMYPPTKLFFRCLAVTDLCVGLISQPLTAITLMAGITYVNENLSYYTSQVNSFSRFCLSAVSILTSTAISVDRLLALLLGLRYRHVVTLRRVRAVIICFWLLSCALGGWRYSTRSPQIARTVFIVVMSLSLLTSVFSYIKIYFLLRHHQQVQDHAHQGQPPNAGEIPLNIARYKKMVSTIAWVQLALLACYLPYSVVGMLLTYRTYRKIPGSMGYFRATVSLLYLNSSLNPILYGWRIREVKQAVKDTIMTIIH